jgi:hypothetical protein
MCSNNLDQVSPERSTLGVPRVWRGKRSDGSASSLVGVVSEKSNAFYAVAASIDRGRSVVLQDGSEISRSYRAPVAFPDPASLSLHSYLNATIGSTRIARREGM